MRFFVRGVHPELDSFSRGVYTERYEILRQAQNDTRNEVLPQDDKGEGLHRMTNQRAPSEIQLLVVVEQFVPAVLDLFRGLGLKI
jgi:hypothetical protein